MASYTDQTNYKESFFLNISMGNTPQWQGSPRTSFPSTQMLCLLCKVLGSCLVILDHLGHLGKEV